MTPTSHAPPTMADTKSTPPAPTTGAATTTAADTGAWPDWMPEAVPVDRAITVASQMVARTYALGTDDGEGPDLLAIGGSTDAMLWHRDGFALAGRGVALRLVLPGGLAEPGTCAAVIEALRAIQTAGDVTGPGTGPVILATLPFDRRATTTLTIPSVLVGQRADGQRWLTTVGRAGTSPGAAADVDLAELSDLPPYTPPDCFSLIAQRSHAEWSEVVADAVEAIRDGRLDKVVLAREVRVEANRPFLPADILRRLHVLYPSCLLFSSGEFLGASPELLISRLGGRVRSHPLAGTVARSGDPHTDAQLTGALLASAKERQEHRLVVDEIASVLGPLCQDLEVPDVPSIVGLRNVSHLGTFIDGYLRDRGVTALDLVNRLHPTPAVAGTPTEAAVDFLRAVEGFDRGCYAGPSGWMDRNGDGEWAVAVRSAHIRGTTARLFAGVGIVADSDPSTELAETQLKLQALLAAVVRP